MRSLDAFSSNVNINFVMKSFFFYRTLVDMNLTRFPLLTPGISSLEDVLLATNNISDLSAGLPTLCNSTGIKTLYCYFITRFSNEIPLTFNNRTLNENPGPTKLPPCLSALSNLREVFDFLRNRIGTFDFVFSQSEFFFLKKVILVQSSARIQSLQTTPRST